jgi:molybdopterin-guanine dinucleotide biosynthesis protein A
MPEKTYPFVVMAGGKTPEKIIETGEDETERAFIDIGGRPMVSWVLDAIRGCKRFDGLLCIGNVTRLNRELGLELSMLTPDLGSMLENFIAGMEKFRDRPLVISSTCDIPLITSAMLDNLIDQIESIDAEIYYPIVDIKYFDAKFPGGRRTTQALKEGTFTGGNVFALNPTAVLKNRSRIEAVIRDRKSPAKLVRLFGLPFILKFAFKQLDLKSLEKKASQILGARMRGVLTEHPEIGFDIDKPVDLNMVRAIVARSVSSK